MQRMSWDKLLSTKRISEIKNCDSEKKDSQFIDIRSPFEKDYDQLTFSYPFRRLQDKTQVIPFPEFDFIHTRLTHSIEVASVGRSLGKMAADLILKDNGEEIFKNLSICRSDIGALVAAACLAHDIGNPPFGHSGEDTIRFYFDKTRYNDPSLNIIKDDGTDFIYDYNNYNDPNYSIKNQVKIEERILKQTYFENLKRWNDLLKYEGNANGFRILCNNCDKGINPTYALLGIYTKYPIESFLHKYPFSEKIPKSFSKFGFFQNEKEIFKIIANDLGLIPLENIGEFDTAFHRHPLAFLVEAADDIAYRMIDFEDGCRLGLIDFDKAYQTNLVSSSSQVRIKKSPKEMLIDIASIDKSFNKEYVESVPDFKCALSYLRSKVINVLIQLSFEQFEKNYKLIMEGQYDSALLENIDNSIVNENLVLMRNLLDIYVYNYKPVLESEASGFEVISSLIESFSRTCNICYRCGDKETLQDKKLIKLLPPEYLPTEEEKNGELKFDEIYSRYLTVLDYITGMTDNFAISLYRKIKGISLPYR